MLLDCADALDAVDIDRWDQFSPQQRRGIGIIARWVIEKSLWSVIFACGQEPPLNVSLMKLYALSGMKLPPEHERLLAYLAERVATHIPDVVGIEDDYQTMFRLAHGVRGMAHNLVTIWDVQERQARKPE